jgi:glycyl-tRNA synthetase (class II)
VTIITSENDFYTNSGFFSLLRGASGQPIKITTLGEQIVLATPAVLHQQQILNILPNNTSMALPHHTQQRQLVEQQIGYSQPSYVQISNYPSPTSSPKRYYQHIHKSSKVMAMRMKRSSGNKNGESCEFVAKSSNSRARYASTQNFMQSLYTQAKISTSHYVPIVQESWIGSSLIPYYLLQTAFTRVVKSSKSSLRFVVAKLIR